MYCCKFNSDLYFLLKQERLSSDTTGLVFDSRQLRSFPPVSLDLVWIYFTQSHINKGLNIFYLIPNKGEKTIPCKKYISNDLWALTGLWRIPKTSISNSISRGTTTSEIHDSGMLSKTTFFSHLRLKLRGYHLSRFVCEYLTKVYVNLEKCSIFRYLGAFFGCLSRIKLQFLEILSFFNVEDCTGVRLAQSGSSSHWWCPGHASPEIEND